MIRGDGKGCSRQIPAVERSRGSSLRPAGVKATPSPPAVHYYKPVIFMCRWARQKRRTHPYLPRQEQPRPNKTRRLEEAGDLPVHRSQVSPAANSFELIGLEELIEGRSGG